MRPQTIKIFAQLCEAINEDSTAMNLITGNAGGSQVVKHLHQKLGLGHDLEFKEIPKISWSDLKDSYKGAWVVMRCSGGTAAIKARGGTTGSYEAIVSDGGEIQSKSDSRGGNILDFIKGSVGKPTKFFAAKNTNKVQDVQRQRRDRQDGSGPQKMDTNTLIKKFKPLWAKAISAAIADIKGHVANMIKNDAFDKARKKLDRVEKLQNNIEALEAGSQEAGDLVKMAVHAAVLMAASHYYPDQTGEITRGYSSGYSSQNSEGVTRLLQDLSNGDTAKLGTVLGFFKRTLISG